MFEILKRKIDLSEKSVLLNESGGNPSSFTHKTKYHFIKKQIKINVKQKCLFIKSNIGILVYLFIVITKPI